MKDMWDLINGSQPIPTPSFLNNFRKRNKTKSSNLKTYITYYQPFKSLSKEV